jgi:type II secretory pathway component GspD/PulD (secretin)
LNSTRRQTGILILLFLIPGFLIWFPIHPPLAAEGQPEEDIFSIRAANEPLREVLKKISKASGYEIRFNTQLADERVSIQLDNMTLNEALARVLQAYNHMSLWDDANYIITLFIFKKNRPPVTLSGMNRIFELATETTAGP